MVRVWTFRIASRASLFGVGTRRIRSKRPVRSIAGSSRSGRFVAPMTQTPSRDSSPSIEVRSCFTTRSLTPLSVSKPRTCAMASSSSRKTMQGATCFAFLKIMRTAFSDSPTHFDMTSGPLIEMKFASDSVATAFASSVFPDPGGPYSKMPRGGRMPIRLNASGSFSGISTASRSFILTSSRPPTSDQFTRGTSTRTSRIALGSTSLRACLKSSGVTRIFSRVSAGIGLSRAMARGYRRSALLAASRASDAPFALAGFFLPLRRDRVEFIDEQDAGSVLLGLLELLAEALLALSVVFRHDLGALNRIEICAGFVGDRLRDERFAGPGRAVQEDPFRRIGPEALEQLRVLQREFDHLADLHQLLLEPADVLIRDGGREDLALAHAFLFHLDDRVVLDLHNAFRGRANYHEGQRAAHEGDPRDDDDVALVQRTLQQTALHEVLDPLTEGDLVALADDRRNRDAFRGQDLGLADLDFVAEAHADVPTHEAVDPDDPLALVLLHDPEQLRRSGLLAQDLDDFPDVHAECHAGLRVNPCAAEPHIGLGRFGHLENNPLRHDSSNSPGLYQGYGPNTQMRKSVVAKMISAGLHAPVLDLARLVDDELLRDDEVHAAMRSDANILTFDIARGRALKVDVLALDRIRGEISAGAKEASRGPHRNVLRFD